jgi:SAM-dependent methyltransferase
MEAAEYTIMREAEDHHWWYVGLHDLITGSVAREAVRLGRPLTMLDAGCGTGRLCQMLQAFGQAEGCDVHPAALETAAKRGLKRLWPADLTSDDLGTERFDAITAIDVLYHRAVTDEGAALVRLHRALKPGGCLVLQVAAFEALRGSHDVAVHTRKRYRQGEVKALLEQAGFVVEFISYRLCPFFLPALVWRARSRANGNGHGHSDVAPTEMPRVNRWLTRYLKLENRLLLAGVRLPAGTSVFAVARKP